MRCTLALVIGVMFSASAVAQFDGLFDGSPEHPAIEYADRPVRDPVAELNRKVQTGAVELKLDAAQGYLRSVLKALNVPIQSQIVVFSKTSVQVDQSIAEHQERIRRNSGVER
jgi:hypothetical protein